MAFDPNHLTITKQHTHSGILFALARPDDSDRIVVGASDFKLHDFDVMADKLESVEYVGHDSYVTGLASTGGQLVSGGYDGRLIWWDKDSRRPIRSIAAHSRWIRDMVATPDGKMIVSVADDMVCRVWNAETGRHVRDLLGHAPRTPHHFPSMLYACAISPDGRYVATGDRIGSNVVWELATGRRLAEVRTPVMYTWDPKARIHSIGGVRSLAFSSDSRLLAVGGIGKIGNIDHLGGPARVEVFDWRKEERTHEFAGNDDCKGLVERLAFGPGDAWLVAAGGDHGGFIKFFDLASGKVIKQDKAPMHVHDFTLSDDGRIFASGHGKAVVWSLTSDS